MSIFNSEPQLSYAQELEARIDSVVEWAIANQPHKIAQLSKDDFIEPRERFITIAKGGGSVPNQEPEPSEGGAQYINDNPAPWP
ncbi:MAG: hypothetical protein EOO53_09050 [Gammaproteobacteria bacterium]|nr:MAG: hypothetical protein EOO53_09050 [Gammaproteobacteria bacterium]